MESTIGVAAGKGETVKSVEPRMNPETAGWEKTLSQREGVKLVKNTRGYGWEITVYAKGKEWSFEDQTRLEDLNRKMLAYIEVAKTLVSDGTISMDD